MTQIATVRRLIGADRAEILVRRQSACGHDCASCGGCGPDAASRVSAVAENPVNARVGDTVRVESESGQVLKMACLLYLVPLVLLFALYFIATGALGWGEGAGMAAGLAGLLFGAAINILLDRRARRSQPLQLRITEVLKSCSDM